MLPMLNLPEWLRKLFGLKNAARAGLAAVPGKMDGGLWMSGLPRLVRTARFLIVSTTWSIVVLAGSSCS